MPVNIDNKITMITHYDLAIAVWSWRLAYVAYYEYIMLHNTIECKLRITRRIHAYGVITRSSEKLIRCEWETFIFFLSTRVVSY
jgi:hypothetical protein